MENNSEKERGDLVAKDVKKAADQCSTYHYIGPAEKVRVWRELETHFGDLATKQEETNDREGVPD